MCEFCKGECMGHFLSDGTPMPDLMGPGAAIDALAMRGSLGSENKNLKRALDHLCETGRLVGFNVGGERKYRRIDILRFIYFGNCHRRSEPAERPIREE